MGQALVDAYEMESKIAFYPRIILSHKIEELVNKNDSPLTKEVIIATPNGLGTKKITQNYSSTLAIRSSDDGYSYLHWLPWCITQMIEKGQIFGIPRIENEPNTNWIEHARDTIENNLKEYKENHSPFTKWRWIAVYFNQVMVEHKLIDHQVNIESIKPHLKIEK